MPLMATDLTETEKSFSVHVDLPGVRPEDLEITVMEGNCLCMKAERHHSHEEKNARVHSMERSYGKVQRKIYLPKNADMDACESRFRNGVLEITIPKKHNLQDTSRKLRIMSDHHVGTSDHTTHKEKERSIQTVSQQPSVEPRHIHVPSLGNTGAISSIDHQWEVKAHFKNNRSLHSHGFCSFRVPVTYSTSKETEWTLPGGEVICFMIPSGAQVGDILTIEFDKVDEFDEHHMTGDGIDHDSMAGSSHANKNLNLSHSMMDKSTKSHMETQTSQWSSGSSSLDMDLRKNEVKAWFKNPKSLHSHGFCQFKIPTSFSTSKETEWTLPGGETICFMIPMGCKSGDILTLEFGGKMEFDTPQTLKESDFTTTTKKSSPKSSSMPIQMMGSGMQSQTLHQTAMESTSDLNKMEVKAWFKNSKSLHSHGFCSYKVPSGFSTSRETEWRLPGGEIICFMIPMGCKVGDTLTLEFDKPMEFDHKDM